MYINKNFTYLLFVLIIASSVQAFAQNGWPDQVTKIEVQSSADHTMQPSLSYTPKTNKQVPLLVALHTWSGDYKQWEGSTYAKWCIENGWALIHPNYRGPNKSPESTGSDLVISDIKDAIKYMQETTNIDNSRIYLIGGSGGGYNSLQVVSKTPEIWAGVSTWVPITDLTAWYYENRKAGRVYANDITASTGGVPDSIASVDYQYLHRSPINWLQYAKEVPIDIAAGIHDGHRGSVPISHSLLGFNKLADLVDRLSEEDIAFFVDSVKVPVQLKNDFFDSSYPTDKPLLFRRISNNVRVTIFDGGHDILYLTGLEWLSKQQKGTSAIFENH